MTAGNQEPVIPEDPGLSAEEPPPILKTWRNLYLLVLGNLLLWIILFYIFTWIFE